MGLLEDGVVGERDCCRRKLVEVIVGEGDEGV